MNDSKGLGGPASVALEGALRTWVRRNGLAFWLDGSSDYTDFVERLQGVELPYEVRTFAGSYLELMMELETLGGGVDPKHLVVYLPGFNEARVHDSPLLELYAAGARFRKRLDTLITEAAAGKVKPEQIEAFKAQPGLTLEGADLWLNGLLAEQAGGLASTLRAMGLPALVDDLIEGDGPVARGLAAGGEAIWAHLAAAAGLPDAWKNAAPAARPRDVAFTVASWALCVEYVHDLRRAPVSPRLAPATALPAAVVRACTALAKHLRAQRKDFYSHVADETETLLADEVEAAKAEDLGEVDTFRFEEAKVMDDALKALGRGAWSAAADWARRREGGGSFWVEREHTRRSAWQLIASAAALGEAIDAAGPRLSRTAGPLSEAVQRYVDAGARVDSAHRHLEQHRVSLLFPRLPCFEVMRVRLDGMRTRWRSWADAWATDFNACCLREGFLPPPDLQQRTIFDDEVKPKATEAGVTAYFMVDALRFEMGLALYEALKDTPATTVSLRPRLAELPTVTAVGMNVLAPVTHGGKLRPALARGKVKGFSTGEFRVAGPEQRKRAMHDRVGGTTCPLLTLEEVVRRDAAALRRSVAQANLVVVHSEEIDAAGEKGAGPAVFELALQKIRAAWRLLRDAGVRRFVITADHGFLMLDGTTTLALTHGRKTDPKRRHVFSEVAADHSGEVRVPLSELGYEGASGHLMFPETTTVFNRGKRPMSFVHGGNSPQERVIPVLTLVHRSGAGAVTAAYLVKAEAQEGVGGMHAISARVIMDAQGTLDFGGQRQVELSLRAVDAPGVLVKLCQTRKGAKLAGGGLVAEVDTEFELFFRLIGPNDARVRIELGPPSAGVAVRACLVDGRFAVTAAHDAGKREPDSAPPPAPSDGWLTELPEGGVRELFQHLAERSAVTEAEALSMLGSPRAVRRFSVKFEEHAAKAPFSVRIDVVSGAKRYVRVGARR